MLPTGFRTFHFVSFLYVFFFSFLFLLFRFFSHYFVFVFFAFRFFSFLFVAFLLVFFSFFFFPFLFVSFRFFPFLSLQVPILKSEIEKILKTTLETFYDTNCMKYRCHRSSWREKIFSCLFPYSGTSNSEFLEHTSNARSEQTVPLDLVGCLRINVDVAIFQPYLDLEAGDNQSLKIQVARPGIEPRSSCSASQELNHSATAAPRTLRKENWNLKLTCRHINRRHFCFNIKSFSVHPLLWMNVMLDFICMVFAGMWTTFR